MEEIIKNNILIAEFMGVKIGVDQYSCRPGILQSLEEGHLNYHQSWGWLMPVVERIEQDNFGFKMCRKVVEIYFDDTKEVILKTKEPNRLQSLYVAIVQFIEWYNSNKQ